MLAHNDGGIKYWGIVVVSFSTDAKETSEKKALQIASTPIFYDRVLGNVFFILSIF